MEQKSTVQVARETQIEKKIHLLTEAIEHLEDKQGCLESRLACLSRKVIPTPSTDEKEGEELVPLANILEDLKERIAMVCGRITSQLDRLEI